MIQGHYAYFCRPLTPQEKNTFLGPISRYLIARDDSESVLEWNHSPFPINSKWLKKKRLFSLRFEDKSIAF